jgi:hypothetical protein
MAVDKGPDKFQFTDSLQFFELELPETGVSCETLVRKLGELGYKVTGSDFGDINPTGAETAEVGEKIKEEQ